MKVLFVSYDNDSHISFFPLGYAYLAAACRKAGHDVSIYQQDTRHWPDEHLIDYLNVNDFDVVCLGTCAGYYQYKRVLAISRAINNVKKRPHYILGGTMVTPEPEYFLRKTGADIVVLGEGEVILCELLDALANNHNLSGVKGIAYLSEDKVIINERPSPPDLDDLPFPAWDLFEMDHYVLDAPYISTIRSTRTVPIISARGCTSHCTFCYRMEKGLRLRSVESVIEEISRLARDYDINRIIFSDELVIASPQRGIELSEAFIKSGLDKIKWGCTGRLDTITPEVLSAVKKAGCEVISYGMELWMMRYYAG